MKPGCVGEVKGTLDGTSTAGKEVVAAGKEGAVDVMANTSKLESRLAEGSNAAAVLIRS